ncbi:uncharacterized protein C16orf46 homolog [Pogona vitticeps]
MTSSGQDQHESNSERTSAHTRSAELQLRCTYPNERRERNQIYTLLNISNSINEEEERVNPEWVNGTGWEDAVQGWSKTPSFAYLQVQKRARKTKASESASGCLYCADLMQGIDKGLESHARTAEQLKSDFRLTTYAATDSVAGKKQSLCPSAMANSSSIEDPKKCSSQGDKKKMTLKEAQASLIERRFFVMKESSLFQADKKTVPIKEYSILPPGKPKSLETLKCKDIKSQEQPSTSSQTTSEASALKLPLVLPPLKDAAPKNGLDPSSRKRQTALSQASEKPLSETTSHTQVFKTKEQNFEKGIHTMYDALKEQIQMHEIASFVPRLAKTSFHSRNLDQCYWHYTLFPDKKIGPMSNAIAGRRHSHPNSVHFLHTKAAQISKANGIQDPCVRSKSHTGAKQQKESKAHEIPLLSGLFPSLTVSRLAVTALPSRLT